MAIAVGACSGTQPADVTTTTGETTSTVTATSTPTGTATFPPAREDVGQGNPTWAAVLAAAESSEDPAIAAAVEAARQAGYDNVGVTDCDEGAPDAFGRPEGRNTVSVYYGSEADARTAAEAFESIGVRAVAAEIRTYCLD